jgi:hypothetical protein
LHFPKHFLEKSAQKSPRALEQCAQKSPRALEQCAQKSPRALEQCAQKLSLKNYHSKIITCVKEFF